jgi:hypothetical protein
MVTEGRINDTDGTHEQRASLKQNSIATSKKHKEFKTIRFCQAGDKPRIGKHVQPFRATLKKRQNSIVLVF